MQEGSRQGEGFEQVAIAEPVLAAHLAGEQHLELLLCFALAISNSFSFYL